MPDQFIIIEAQYLPPVQYFTVLAQAGTVYLEAQEHYQKRSYRNRARLAGANGPMLLSVPLQKGKHQQMPIHEVEIDYKKPWFGEHWHSIKSAYGKSPFFEFYAEPLEAILRSKPASLFELNRALLQQLLQQLQLDVQIRETTAYGRVPGDTIDLREAIHPKHPKLHFEPRPYPQVFKERHGFLPNLSILDLLFCTGPQAPLLLKQFADQNPIV
ncbi:MAG: WbqC family protein [Phaeodactylibacter sp.]|uniref:WbqC family protein n=1 Tax=Phaeodactylibacter sp. TaxID=1940289 RepID=UPI0032EB0285